MMHFAAAFSPLARRWARPAITALVLAVLGATGASAQSQTNLVSTFAGQWQALDPALSDGSGTCKFTLEQLAVDGKLAARAADCEDAVSSVAEWAIIENQIVMKATDGSLVMRLGGNQKRLTGETAQGKAVILEARGGDGNAAALQSALNGSGCLYLGYTDKCAAPNDEARPTVVDGKGEVMVLVDLNARTTPRADGTLLGVVKQGTCLVVNQCTLASDGVWCRADFNGKTGWVSKLALRQSKWPVVTYQNNC